MLRSDPAPYVEPKIVFPRSQTAVDQRWNDRKFSRRWICVSTTLTTLGGSLFNVGFSEQHHTLRKEFDAQRRNFERSSARTCTTVLVQCSDLVKEFEIVKTLFPCRAKGSAFLTLPGLLMSFSGRNLNEAGQSLATFD